MLIKRFLIISLLLFCIFPFKVTASSYYISPTGGGLKNGNSSSNAFESFSSAWSSLKAGDTLFLMDGVYKGPMRPSISGTAGNPITIKAINDGMAIIDGGGTNEAIRLGTNYDTTGEYFILDGLTARNGSTYVIILEGDNNVLRRVSAYNADPDSNSTVLMVWSSNNLLEDIVAAGSGRYMLEVYTGGNGVANNNTIRRAFTYWQNWDGKHFCGVAWPNGTNIGIYNSSNTILENGISYGKVPGGIMAQANDTDASLNNVQVLGTISVLTGLDYNGSVWTFGSGQLQPTSRPGPIVNPYPDYTPCPDGITQWEWGNQRLAFQLWGQGNVNNVVFKDILAVDSAGVGFSAYDPIGSGVKSNNIIDHSTIYNSAKGIVASWEKNQDKNGNLYLSMSGVSKPTNSNILGLYSGEGARLQNMYINKTLTNNSLWPWPMEERIKKELVTYYGVQNFSVTNEVCQKYLSSSGSTSKGYSMNVNCNLGGPVPTVIYSSPTPLISPSPTKIPTPTTNPSINPIFDVNDDGIVNLKDILEILTEILR